MKFIDRLVNILILIGGLSFLAGLIIKVFLPGGITWLSVNPSAFLKFANTCLLLAISFSLREIIIAKARE
ncbi:MAG: hypothetical protein SV062_06810 [Thermodesulfobacteriota bacterium]|nr:hypothetical protein [Thermodesulfobacteriota bacterium]